MTVDNIDTCHGTLLKYQGQEIHDATTKLTSITASFFKQMLMYGCLLLRKDLLVANGRDAYAIQKKLFTL